MRLLVFAYPLHQLASIESVRRARKYLPVSSVTIVWDDLHTASDSLDQAIRVYREYLGPDVQVVPHSLWGFEVSSGWLRQQWIKLSLHRVFPEDHWAILDGDCWLNAPVDLRLGWAYKTSEYYAHYWTWAGQLGLSYPGYSRIHALNIFERRVLASFEQTYPNIYRDFVRWDRANPGSVTPGFSEFELYYSHAEQRMGLSYQDLAPILMGYDSPQLFLEGCDHRHSVLLGHDEDLLSLGWRA